MLKKSKASAIVMSGIAVLSVLLTLVLWIVLRGRLNFAMMRELPLPSSEEKAIITFFALLMIMVFAVLPGAFIIHNWDDSYFGIQGAIRWVLFGVVFGSLSQIRYLIPDGTTDKGFISFMMGKGISFILGFTFLYLSHWVAFKLLKR